MSLYRGVLISLILLSLITVAVLVYVQMESISRLYQLYQPGEVTKVLKSSQKLIRKTFQERTRAKRPVDDLKGLSESISQQYLLLEELDILKDELKVYLVVSNMLGPVLLFILAIVGVLVLLSYLNRPIKTLTQAMQSYARGDSSVFPLKQIGIGKSRLLIESSNHMISTIKSQQDVISSQGKFLGWRESAKEMVHEIKNILTPSKLYAESALEKLIDSGDTEAIHDIRLLTKSLQSLERMSVNLKELSNIRVPVVEAVDLYLLARSSVKFYSKQFNRIRYEGESCVVLGDSDLIRSALDNLVTNAIESIGKGGGEIIVRVKSGDAKIIECEDSGGGICSDIQSKIFRINFTTKKNGSGFGLYYVQKVMTSLGGSLEYESARD
ncbi:MAG: HAMP domain-containing histidine kinase, partial [Spirochaetota bacterium]|nr:HAMP domain-containing histidine kinase [Spirochaetota bacterium]